MMKTVVTVMKVPPAAAEEATAAIVMRIRTIQ